MSDTDMIAALAEEIKSICLHKKFMIATAESCTGGLLAGALTSVPGLSDVFDRGYITYSEEAKAEDLGVSPKLIDEKGAVSAEVARAMAEGAKKRAKAKLSISVTGIAGPTGATAEKPIGRVHIAVALRGAATTDKTFDFGDIGRDEVRRKSVIAALEFALERLKHNGPH
jgi:nicotinamide-nucleotide amidase